MGYISCYMGLTTFVFYYEHMDGLNLRYGVYLGEPIAPAMILVGLFVRIAALLIALTMLMSIYLFYGLNAFILDQYGALTSQVNIFFFFSSLSIFFLGAGNYSIYKGNGKWN